MPIFDLPPGMLALTDGGDQHDDYEDIGEGPWPTHRGAREFRDSELHPDLAAASRLHAGPEGWSILVPRLLRQQVSGSGQHEVLTPSHPAQPAPVTDMLDPAYPKITAWHNDIAYTVPVHPQALSKEHAQALADYEVHRRQHEKLEKELHGEHDEYGDRPWVVSEEAARRLDRSQQQLNRLRDLAQGAGHAAVGTINSYHKFTPRKFYQAVRQGQHREYRGQVLPDREAAEGSMPGGQIEEFPGIWSIVDHRGRVVWSGLSSHPYYSNFGDPGWRERILADARNKNLVARRLSHSFGDPPDIDMSRMPISTYGKTRKKTGEWFSNLPPGMIPVDEPPELAGTDAVEQE